MNNNDLCSQTAHIRLQQLQNEYWSHKSFLEEKFSLWTKKNTNLTKDLLNILKLQGITFKTTNNQNICIPPKGGHIPISTIVDNVWYNRHRSSLKQRQILYVEQLLNNN